MQNFSTGTARLPLGPATLTMQPAATRAGTLSAAGEALHRLPPAEARPWTWVEPIRLQASITPGQALRSFLFSPITAAGVAAPMVKAPLLLGDAHHLGDLLDVDDHAGRPGAGLHLDQEIGAAGQDVPLALGCLHHFDRLFDGFCRLILDFTHAAASPLEIFCGGEAVSKRTASRIASRTCRNRPIFRALDTFASAGRTEKLQTFTLSLSLPPPWSSPPLGGEAR